MRWEDGRRSDNVEDIRGGGGSGGGGGGVKLAFGGGAGGIILAVLYVVLGGDPADVVQVQEAPTTAQRGGAAKATSPEEDRQADFVSVVLADTEDTWTQLFKAQGKTYRKPKLVLFTDAVRSACGRQSAAVGPFYCPGDRKVYIDLSFFKTLHQRFKAPGDFAQAYVIAHEVGHHVQNELGTSAAVHRQKRGLPKAQANALSVRLELQADCYAGIWAHHANRSRNILERGDLEEALGAASAIGDDTLQRQATGRVMPESFTHGSAKQRQAWFSIGMKHGSIARCDTFKNPSP